MTNSNDNRRGNFNFGGHVEKQIYNEAPQKRNIPSAVLPLLERISKDNVPVQIRVYGQELEMQTCGRNLARAMQESGFEIIFMDGDHGTRRLKGLVIEPAGNERSLKVAREIANALRIVGMSADVGSGPWKDDKPFVRIAIGVNA